MLQPAGQLHALNNHLNTQVRQKRFDEPLIEVARRVLWVLMGGGTDEMVEQRFREYCKKYDFKGLIFNAVHEHVLLSVRTSSDHPYQHAVAMLRNLVPPDEVNQWLRDYCTHYDLAPPWFGDLKGRALSAVAGSRIKATFLDDRGKEYQEVGTALQVMPYEGILSNFTEGNLMLCDEDPWEWYDPPRGRLPKRPRSPKRPHSSSPKRSRSPKGK